MFIRILLLSMLILTATAQAQDTGSSEGYASTGCPRDNMRYQEMGRGRGMHRSPRDRYRRGEGCGGYNRGGGNCGGHSWWDIPVQEARRLNPIEVSQQSLKRGEALFRANCTRCHGDYGFGDGPQARQLSVPPANLHHAARHYSDGELFYIIRKGREPMPAWEGKLSEEELWNLINYLRFEIGAHRRGPRFSDCNDRYRPAYAVPDTQTGQSTETPDEANDDPPMDRDDSQGEHEED